MRDVFHCQWKKGAEKRRQNAFAGAIFACSLIELHRCRNTSSKVGAAGGGKRQQEAVPSRRVCWGSGEEEDGRGGGEKSEDHPSGCNEGVGCCHGW
ncbi:hypothetical protein BDZ91DRAFT_746136 [Kalaharituber pfeilii]|nr:hypothetical protein BDZ91DRAFT_746136 [Kalaharituber pfeilii]